ncbi:MAG: hypothetical protein KJT03_05300 [Verrucomicrobiae bacterium]|nr:hypothetical protein [Verrucomicrobiae bacterium]
MSYKIQEADLLIRETPPDRLTFAIGSGQSAKRRPRAILLVRLLLSDDRGRTTWGISGDRPSFGWLDKRTGFTPEQKLERLFQLVRGARDIYLNDSFDSPFEHWLKCHREIVRLGAVQNHESLSSTYASALMERAMLDAFCRLHGVSMFDALKQGLLNPDFTSLDSALDGIKFTDLLPLQPRTSFHIRHTVGLSDPLRDSDIAPEQRINDGEPESLEAYARRDGLRYFKVKIGGNSEQDLERLERIWSVLVELDMPTLTLDGNESYTNIDAFACFVELLEDRLLGLYQHIAFIEQPLTRELTMDRETAAVIQRISREKPLIIDEADADLDSFARAREVGYLGVSHKNCKGFFKSLLNRLRCHVAGPETFQSAEDLSLMPLAPLHQDFAALGILDISHCERNGHHYGLGLSHLTKGEQGMALEHHPDLYIRRGSQVFLNIRQGQVNCASLQCPGFGVKFQPDWESLTPLDDWQVLW